MSVHKRHTGGWMITGVALGIALSYPAIAQDVPAPAPTQNLAPAIAPNVPAATPTAPAAEPVILPADPAAPAIATADPLALPPIEDSRQTLETVQASITLSRQRIDELKREIDDMDGDRSRQNAALIAAGQRVKLAEIEIADVESRLDDLIVQELEVRGRLDGADTNIANVLAALERISRNPPPALIVDPSDALGSARSAILIAAILPQLRVKADAVTADLTRLTDIKVQAVAEEETLRANFSVLEEEQLRIATLIAARRQGVEVMSTQLAAEEQEAIALAARATSLQDLIASLEQRMTSVANASAAANANTSSEAVPLTEQAIRTALANTARTEPAIPFSAARSYLTMPTNGVNVINYGASDGFGGIAQGLSIVTRADAQIVAPADGWVLYKGAYLNYGQIIILNTGQDYTALLAGLDTVTVDIGQFVLMGEPIGTMGSRTIGRTVTTSAGNSQPTLYIELRKDNEPIDPTGWWAPQTNPTQSG